MKLTARRRRALGRALFCAAITAAPIACQTSGAPVQAEEKTSAPLFENGCSIPGWGLLDAVIDVSTLWVTSPNDGNPTTVFDPACIRHDDCYHSGLATYGKTRAQCDKDLYDDAKHICNAKWGRWWETWQRLSCKAAAWEVYTAVRAAGEANYHTPACKGGQVIVTEDQAATGGNALTGTPNGSTPCSTFEPYAGTPNATQIRTTEMISDLEAARPGQGAATFADLMQKNAYHAAFRNWVNRGDKCEELRRDTGALAGDGFSYCGDDLYENPNYQTDPQVKVKLYDGSILDSRQNRYMFIENHVCEDGHTQVQGYEIDAEDGSVWYDLLGEFFPDKLAERRALIQKTVVPSRCWSQGDYDFLRFRLATPGRLTNWYDVWKEAVGKKGTDEHAQEAEAQNFLIDYEYYLQLYPELNTALGGDLARAQQHWAEHGIDEGRTGSPVFDVRYYLAKYPDVSASIGDRNFKGAMGHFLTYGLNEGRASSAIFDIGYYFATYPALRDGLGGDKAAGVRHYLEHGMAEGRRASADFDPVAYLADNPDIANHCGATNYPCAVQHYLTYGRYELRPGAHYEDVDGGGSFIGCRGKGNYVCSEKTDDFPYYHLNHPSCLRNANCIGVFYSCNERCPEPGPADR